MAVVSHVKTEESGRRLFIRRAAHQKRTETANNVLVKVAYARLNLPSIHPYADLLLLFRRRGRLLWQVLWLCVRHLGCSRSRNTAKWTTRLKL